MKEILILRWSSRLWYPIQIRKKGLRRRFAANSISDAAQVLSVLKQNKIKKQDK
jgi:hypothetical protein